MPGPFLILTSGLKVRTGAATIRCPGLVVTLSAIDRKSDLLAEPLVVIEILSPSKEREDRTRKLEEYRATASIQLYVILEQERVAATVFRRGGDSWLAETLQGDSVLELAAISISIPLRTVYAGVDPTGDGSDAPV